MHEMNFEIFKYIMNLQNKIMEQEDIFFLIKKENDLNLQFLSQFIESCRTVNIVTNDLARFQRIQENLYENENILITVSNNKSKSLKKAKYIFNVNMEEKEVQKFKINRQAIIVNFKNKINRHANSFQGVNVNDFQIYIPDEILERFENINNDFESTKLYESILMQEYKQNEWKKKFLQDGIYITGLIGNNGVIDKREIINNVQRDVENLSA